MTLVLAEPLEAARRLVAGELVAFPTETVYGLGGDATRDAVLAAIFAAKGRPRFNPLICHFADAEAVFAAVEESATARLLAGTFWPGPLTLVLRRRAACRVGLLASAGLDSLAVRVPDSPLALALLRAAGVPVAAPSANLSGRVSPTTAAHVLAELEGRIGAVLDGDPCPVGLESTVVDLTGDTPLLLRPGGLAAEAVEAVLGVRLARGMAPAAQGLRSPGMMASHYAPAAALRLNATAVAADEALLAFGAALPGAACCWSLSDAGDVREAAARLFAGLRWLDGEVARRGLRGIAAMAVPGEGLGEAVNDRLARAAAPRGVV